MTLLQLRTQLLYRTLKKLKLNFIAKTELLNTQSSTSRSAINQRQILWKKYKILNMRYKQGFI